MCGPPQTTRRRHNRKCKSLLPGRSMQNLQVANLAKGANAEGPKIESIDSGNAFCQEASADAAPRMLETSTKEWNTTCLQVRSTRCLPTRIFLDHSSWVAAALVASRY